MNTLEDPLETFSFRPLFDREKSAAQRGGHPRPACPSSSSEPPDSSYRPTCAQTRSISFPTNRLAVLTHSGELYLPGDDLSPICHGNAYVGRNVGLNLYLQYHHDRHG